VKKTRKPQTLAARVADAQAAMTSGLAMFEEAAMRLDAAQAAHEAIADEARREVARLSVIAAEATEQAGRSARAAVKVRDLIA